MTAQTTTPKVLMEAAVDGLPARLEEREHGFWLTVGDASAPVPVETLKRVLAKYSDKIECEVHA